MMFYLKKKFRKRVNVDGEMTVLRFDRKFVGEAKDLSKQVFSNRIFPL